jgi:hypothetical protein
VLPTTSHPRGTALALTAIAAVLLGASAGCGSTETVTTSFQGRPAQAPGLRAVARCLRRRGFRPDGNLSAEEITFAGPSRALVSVLHFDDAAEGLGIARGLETKSSLRASRRIVYTVDDGILVVAVTNPSPRIGPLVFACTSRLG